MKPFKTIFSSILLCFCVIFSVQAQQFKLSATPNSAYFLDNIYDLRNAGTAANRPAGLVRFTPTQGAALNGTSIQHYSTVNGSVLTPIFNYIATNPNLRNLRGAKFTEGFGSYFITGLINQVSAAGTNQDQIFLMRVNSTTAAIQQSKYVQLPLGWQKLEVLNILLINNSQLYVSGNVLVNNRLQVFLLRTDINLNAVGFFRLYPLTNRNFRTDAHCLINEGGNGLVMGGLDDTNGRAVAFRVSPLNGNILSVMAYNLCTQVACRPITRMSLGRSGNFPNMMVQTGFNLTTLFNVAQMNPTWTNFVNQTTHAINQNWDVRSSRYENGGILLGHVNNTALRQVRERFNPATGALLAGTFVQYNPPTLDFTGITRLAETITLTGSNRIFTVGKYRDAVTNSTRFLGEFQPSSPNCQSSPALTTSPERLALRNETIVPTSHQMPMPPLPTTRVELPTTPVQICSAAFAGGGVETRENEDENTEMALQQSDIKVFPNPFRQEIVIETPFSNVAEIMLFDMTGRMLRQENFGGTSSIETLNLTELSSGLYLLRVRDSENNWHYRKMMKE